jgi:hypothetical protein
MAIKPVIIFDTSALNKLADDADSVGLMAHLASESTVRLTGTSVDEIGASPTPDRRRKLFSLCKRLLSAGCCILPHHLLCETLISAHFSAPKTFDHLHITASTICLEGLSV